MKMKTAQMTGTGAAINISLGFSPKKVEIYNETSNDKLVWLNSMADGEGVKQVAAGTTTFITSNGISAYSGATGPIALSGTSATTAGSATVTGSSSKFTTELAVGDMIEIPGTGLNREQKKVIAIASATSLTVDSAFAETVSGKTATKLSGASEGFTLGADTDINVNGEIFHYCAFAD